MTKLSWPSVKHEINTTGQPGAPSGGDTWVDVTTAVIGFKTTRGRTDELTDVQAGTMDWTLSSNDGRFDPLNPGSDLYPYLRPSKQARTSVTWGSNLCDINTATGEGGIGGWIAAGNTTPPFSTTTNGSVQGTHNISFGPVTAGLNIEACSDNDTVAVVAGQTYTAICSMASWLTQRQINLSIRWFNSGGALFSEQWIGPDQMSVAGYNFLCGSLVAPAGATRASLGAVVRNASENWSLDAAGIFSGTTTFWSPPPTTYPLFYGYEEKGWPVSYDNGGRQQWCKPTFVDAFGPLAQIGLSDALSSEMLLDQPAALYPMGEAGGALLYNVSAVQQPAFTLIPYNGTTYALGQGAPYPANPDSLTALALVLPTSTSVSAYASIFPSVALAGMGTVGASVECWASISTEPVSTFTFAQAGNRLSLTINISGQIQASALGATVTGPFVCNGQAHHYVATVDPSSGTLTLYVDCTPYTVGGASLPSAPTSLSFGGLNASLSAVEITLAMLAAYPVALTSGRVQAHYQVGRLAGQYDKVSQRVARVLNYAGWPASLRSIAASDSGDANALLQSVQQFAASTALSQLLAAADSAMALLDVDGSGNVRYRSRDFLTLQTAPVVTFGENAAAGEVPYSSDVEFDVNPQYIYSVIEIDQANGPTIRRGDAQSQLDFFPRTLQLQSQLQDASLVADFADELLRRYKNEPTPQTRVAKLTVDPVANPQIWSQVLQLDFGSRVRVNRRYAKSNGAGYTKTLDCYIQGISHNVTVDPDSWKIDFLMSPVPPGVPWILGDAVYGVLGSTTTLYA